jgi:hypothetical protein
MEVCDKLYNLKLLQLVWALINLDGNGRCTLRRKQESHPKIISDRLYQAI